MAGSRQVVTPGPPSARGRGRVSRAELGDRGSGALAPLPALPFCRPPPGNAGGRRTRSTAGLRASQPPGQPIGLRKPGIKADAGHRPRRAPCHPANVTGLSFLDTAKRAWPAAWRFASPPRPPTLSCLSQKFWSLPTPPTAPEPGDLSLLFIFNSVTRLLRMPLGIGAGQARRWSAGPGAHLAHAHSHTHAHADPGPRRPGKCLSPAPAAGLPSVPPPLPSNFLPSFPPCSPPSGCCPSHPS